jgi:hypothetical protein
LGLLLHAIVHPADIQDRDGGILVMANLFGMFPFLRKLLAAETIQTTHGTPSIRAGSGLVR